MWMSPSLTHIIVTDWQKLRQSGIKERLPCPTAWHDPPGWEETELVC